MAKIQKNFQLGGDNKIMWPLVLVVT